MGRDLFQLKDQKVEGVSEAVTAISTVMEEGAEPEGAEEASERT